MREDPGTTAVFLDLDGTLAPIVERPGDVAIDPEIRVLLAALVPVYGLVGFVSGRGLAELTRIVALRDVAYSGNHGHQVVDRTGMPLRGSANGEALRAFLHGIATEDLVGMGIWIEDKGATGTLHYRTAPDREVARAFLEQTIAAQAIAAGLRAAPGRMSLEIHPPDDISKGTAVQSLLATVPGARSAISVGDDRTDVTAWVALRDQVSVGTLDRAVGIGVLSDEVPDEVVAGADAMVPGIAGVRDLLAYLVHPSA
jgi:trehalose 6-phosphate phosphatase